MDNIFGHVPRLGIMQIFDNAQRTHSNDRYLKNLFNIFSENNHSKFILEFLQCLAICMVNMEKQLSTERVLDFAAKYCIYHSSQVDEENNVLLLAVFEFIFNNHNRKTPAIRFRTCEFVNRLLNKMGPQATLDDDIFQKMATTMLERLQDRLPSVRAQAVMALQRLQDPPNKNCRIIRAFMFHMETDPSCEVRTRVVQNIAVTQKTLLLIFGRLQDVKETVRKEAYKSLTRLKPRKLSIAQRQTILTVGLGDRADSVKNVIIDHVIPTWFKVCESNLVEFLKILDVVSFKKETVTAVLGHVFRDLPSSELLSVVERLQEKSEGHKLIPISDLSPETVTIWSSVVKHIGIDSCDDSILPELSYFAKYIKEYGDNTDLKDTDNQYILGQLLEISKCYSLMDEMGRKQLIQTCLDLLKADGTGTEVIPPLVKLLELLIPVVKQRMIIMAELISDIREPLEADDSQVEALVENSVEGISEGMQLLNCASQSQSLDDCMRSERTDPDILVKCLVIVMEMLKSPSITKVDDTLLSLKEHFILLCFKVDDARVQRLALDALALLCYWNLDLAKEYFLKFCIQITDDTTCISAVEAVFDLILIHGFEAFSFGWDYNDASAVNNTDHSDSFRKGGPLNFDNDKTISSPVTRRLVSLITNLLSSNVNEVKCKASQGLCKLLLSSRLDSYIVLSHLIILWFSSASDSEPYIRQPLGLFFSSFSKRAGAAEIILSAFSPTLRAIEELIDEDIDSMKVANLFIALLRSDICNKASKPKEGKGSYHARLAEIILDEIKMDIIQQQVLMKILSSLEFDDSDALLAKDLEFQAQKIYKWLQKRTNERRNANIIKKFIEEMVQLRKKLKTDETLKANHSVIIEEPETVQEENKKLINDSCIQSEKEVQEDDNISPTASISCGAIPETSNKIDTQDSIINDSDTSREVTKRKNMTNGDSMKIVEETSDSSQESDDIVPPSPPKRRMLRSRKK
ncbi:unnamed protein product [Nezara viridula]|uniref:Nuclear condensin complex subunit 3 C-terminal domain-containing protein n=1 Tax=Nezara viridula TaxID=85310 RepID=A0A9P0MQT8_NEZVI|nr:unnamed protein product [Nezara viridula]